MRFTALGAVRPYGMIIEILTLCGHARGPHVDVSNPWPMALISAIYGTDDDKEISSMLNTILSSTAGLGLIHESQNIHDSKRYSRPWFAVRLLFHHLFLLGWIIIFFPRV